MQNIHSSRQRCSCCGKLLIAPMGNPHSPFLLVGDGPGHNENIQGVPFAFRTKPTQTLGGDILKDELVRVGIMLNTVLVTNLWQHGISYKTVTEGKKSKQVYACPLEFHLDQLVKMFEGRTHVLLMGSQVTQALLGVNVQSVSGIKVEVPGHKKIRFWVSPNPALAFAQPIGELRLAFRRFSEDISRKK